MSDLSVPRVVQETRNQQLLASTPIARTMLGTAATAVLSGFTGDFYVKALWASNVGGSNTTWTAHIVEEDGSASDANRVARAVAINANTAPVLVLSETLLETGQTIQMLGGDADSVQVWGWGYAFSGGALA